MNYPTDEGIINDGGYSNIEKYINSLIPAPYSDKFFVAYPSGCSNKK